MARTWLAIRVELLGGRGEDLWPYPGRMVAVGPSHTFHDVAEAIDDAFARWDRAHLRQFTLASGVLVTDQESGAEFAGSSFGPFPLKPLVLDQAKVARTVEPGDEFSYVFDLGDEWTHLCTVGSSKVDPREVLGIVPKRPLPYGGWGSIPDQYGRRWDGDTGEESIPQRPSTPHPMLTGRWPNEGPVELVNLADLRGATYRGDIAAIVAAVQGREIDDLLQHVGTAAEVVLASDPQAGEALALSVVNRLRERDAPGDDVLAEDLLAWLRGLPVVAGAVPVDLSEVATMLEGDQGEPGGYLDLRSGEIVPEFLTDPAEVGEDGVIDIDAEPDRWLELNRLGSRDGWGDMAAFTARERNSHVRQRLESAIQGRGAFRRFRDVLAEEGLIDRWRGYSDDRSIGRAREYLAGRGVRAVPPTR